MLSSKSKSSMSEFSGNKSNPATPRVSKIGRLGSAKVDPDSLSPRQNSRPSVERSPRSVNSKPTPDRRSPKIITPPDKQPRPLKGSELQAQLSLLQDDLKKVKEKLAFEEEEKVRALEELKEAKNAAEEVNEKLEDALLSQKMAEESSELDKFRADELEQAAIEAAQRKEEEWLHELGNVRNQHAVDVSALLSATQELERVKQELVMTTEAKNTALGHADDAMRIAESNADKVDMLSGEMARLKSLHDSNLDRHSREMAEMSKKFHSEAEVLKLELEMAKAAEEQLVDLEGLVKGLNVQVLNAKMDESNALSLVDEWKKKVELLKSQLEEASQSEKGLKTSLDSVMNHLAETKVMSNETKSEVTFLKEKVETLELEVAKHKKDLRVSNQILDLSKQQMLDIENTAESLKSDIQNMEEEKVQALNNEKMTLLNLEILTQENSRLAVELDIAKEESEKGKKAMEGLASALHEASMEARDGQERLLIKQSQFDSAAADVVELKSVLKNVQEKNELILDEANYEIICLKKSIERSETEAKDLRNEWDLKECNLISAITKLEEEIASIKSEKNKAMEALEKQKNEAEVADEVTNKLQEKLKRIETELVAAKKSMEKEMAESLKSKERLLDIENELQNLTQENDELRTHNTAALEKIKELSNLLTELTSGSKENGDLRGDEGNGELSKEYDLLPMTADVKLDMLNEINTKESGATEGSEEFLKKDSKLGEIEKDDGNSEKNHNDHGNSEKEEPVKMEVQVCERVETIYKQLSSDREDNTESLDDEFDSKIENSNLDHVNGLNARSVNTSPINEQQQQQHRKKNPLLQKFGNMLKKKSSNK